MKIPINQPVLALILFAGIAMAIVGLGPRGDGHDHDAHAAEMTCSEGCTDHVVPLDEHEDHEEEGHEGHNHEQPLLDLDELALAQCEHEIKAIECDECRYEFGVAKLDPELAKALIQTQTVTVAQSSPETLVLNGEIELNLTRVAQVTSTGSGRLDSIIGLQGQTVAQDAPLAVLQSAELGRAQAALQEALAQAELAQTAWQREQQLMEQNISSQADYQQAQAAWKKAQAMLESTHKQLDLFGPGVTTSQDFGRLTLTAPISGTIIEQNALRGQWVEPQQSLYTVADLSNLWFWATVYEKDLQRLIVRSQGTQPTSAEIRFAAFSGRSFPATLALIGQTMEHDTRTIRVRFDVPNPDGLLRPAMFGQAEVALGATYPVIKIPATAVLSDEDQDFVFIRWQEDLWVRRDVEVLKRSGDWVELLSGIEPGMTVAIQGAFMFKSEVLKEKMGAGCAH